MKRRQPFSLLHERNAAIVRAFDSLASLGFQVVQREEKTKPRKAHPPRHNLTIAAAEHDPLRHMASRAVWLEVGGRAAGWQGQITPRGFKTQRQLNEQGTGRTHWVGMPEWARGLAMNRAAIQNAVEKAIAGEWLGKRQTLCLRIMLAEIRGNDLPASPEEHNASDCPF